MITRVLRSGRPGVLFKFALLAAGALVFGPGSATAQAPAKAPAQAKESAEVVVYRFKFTAGPPGRLCTITQEDVVFEDKLGKTASPRYCKVDKVDKKCGRARVQKGDSISFEETADSTFESTLTSTKKLPSGKKVDFYLVFDPFKYGPVPGNQRKTLHKMKGVTGSKTYTFSVVAAGCNTLDPIVVVDH
jgi:hypothetical protein